MEEPIAARYWCYLCSQMVSPILEDEIKCPFCRSGFVEEMSSSTQDPDSLSLLAPILLGMMGNPRRRRRLRRIGFDEDDGDNNDGESRHGGEIDIDHEFESFIRRRRRSSATILQLLQGIRAGMAPESDNSEGDRDRDRDGDRDRDRERVILINPLNRTIIVQGSHDSNNGQNQNHTPIGSLGDYFIGPGLDLLLQHLAENDPNRYGTPPAQKEAIEALPSVTVKHILQCSVCLDDFEMGSLAKEMPCKHIFHDACILPWLELHNSCPVCRFQLTAEESKSDSERSRSNQREREDNNGSNISSTSSSSGSSNSNNNENNTQGSNSNIEEGEGEGRSGNWRRFLWPFSNLFSSGGSNSPSNSSSSSANAPGNSSTTGEN